MHTHHTNSTGRPDKVALSKSATGLMAATLLASASVIMMPTAASAFDIGGLVQGAIVQYASQYAGGGYRFPIIGGQYARVHVASHHSSHSDDDDDADATPGSTNTPPARQLGDTPPHLSGDSTRMVAQSTDNGRTVTTARSYGDEPSFAPSR
jgi:hypothetical protein